MTAPSVPRRRARKPKVRSGCVTCKARRIKCDEAQPICGRCAKSRLSCEYISSEPNHTQQRSQRSYLPILQAKAREDVAIRLLLGVQRHEFKAPEVLYFDLFRYTIVSSLSLNGYAKLWSHSMLRESKRDDCVRDCILGIGALCRAIMDQVYHTKFLGPALWTVPAVASTVRNTRYYRDALQYYTKAISKLRHRMSLEGPPTQRRSILVISILIIIFEAMQGNVGNIDQIMHSALIMLKDYLSSLNGKQQASASLDDEGIQEADFFLTRLFAFSSLLSPTYTSLIGSSAFQKHWLVRDPIPDWDDDPRKIEIEFERYTTSTIIWCFRQTQTSSVARALDLVECIDEHRMVSNRADAWCDFIERKIGHETDPAQRRTWRTILVQAKMFSVYTTHFHGLEDGERVWDSRLDDLRDAVDLAEVVLNDTNSSASSTRLVEDKLLPVMRCFICRCYDYKIRMKALALCSKITPPWFEKEAIMVGLKVKIEFEERARDASGFIPYRSRYRWDYLSWNEDRTELRMGLIGTITGDTKEIVIHRDAKIDDIIKSLVTS
ncbi:hypothetical protein F5Y04DRAFT_289187 [Hypomontagnella monticulosa]|nr:hypothetical protein F5Y04DRAFT_289187 [Hypomontagnella monticulosa]